MNLKTIYNNQGLLQTHTLQEGENNTYIDVSNLTSGIYTVAIFRDNQSVASAQLIVL